MEREANLSKRLEDVLGKICEDPQLVRGIMFLLETDEERKRILEIAENGGEEATPKNLTYAAINIDDERE